MFHSRFTLTDQKWDKENACCVFSEIKYNSDQIEGTVSCSEIMPSNDRQDRRSRSRSRRREEGSPDRSRDRSRSSRRSKRKHSRREREDKRSAERRASRDEPSYRARSLENSESDFAKLTEVLSSILKTGSRRSHFINEKILPEFNPEIKQLSAKEWLEKVDLCGEMYDWDERTKLYLAILKLRGNAKLWHDGLQNSLLTWGVFSLALIKQFPGEESFGKLIEDAVLFKSTTDTDLQTYCFTKMGKINKLKIDITEDKIVDWIAHGIHDDSIKTIVLAARCKTVSELNNRLSIFTNSKKSKESKDEKENKGSKRVYQLDKGDKEKKLLKSGECFKCGEKGHIKRNCPKANMEVPVSKIKTESNKVEDKTKNRSNEDSRREQCTFCGKKGHVVEKCYKKIKMEGKDKSA